MVESPISHTLIFFFGGKVKAHSMAIHEMMILFIIIYLRFCGLLPKANPFSFSVAEGNITGLLCYKLRSAI
jgi:hypothetical protein